METRTNGRSDRIFSDLLAGYPLLDPFVSFLERLHFCPHDRNITMVNGRRGRGREDRFERIVKGIPVSFLPFVFSYFPMGGSRKHVFKIIAIRMFTIIVYVRICIVIHLFFEKTKTHSRKGSVYVYFFLKTKRPNICIHIYIFLQLGRVITS